MYAGSNAPLPPGMGSSYGQGYNMPPAGAPYGQQPGVHYGEAGGGNYNQPGEGTPLSNRAGVCGLLFSDFLIRSMGVLNEYKLLIIIISRFSARNNWTNRIIV